MICYGKVVKPNTPSSLVSTNTVMHYDHWASCIIILVYIHRIQRFLDFLSWRQSYATQGKILKRTYPQESRKSSNLLHTYISGHAFASGFIDWKNANCFYEEYFKSVTFNMVKCQMSFQRLSLRFSLTCILITLL